MSGEKALKTRNKSGFIIAFIVLLLIAFIQCYKTTHDLNWGYIPDYDRDIGFIQNTLNGHFGKDPNYLGEFLWYNPLIFTIEAAIVKVTGLPINVVVTRAGTYLNLLGPLAFMLMLLKFFDYKIALAAMLSYLFLAAGNIPSWGAATYSPWIGSDCFMQFIFYLNIFLCYKAFSEQKYSWFLILGISLGVSFLGATAPTLFIILIMAWLQTENTVKAVKAKDYPLLKKYLTQGLAAFIPFIIVALPFLYFIIGKYHMHFINREILELSGGIFSVYNYMDMIKINISFSLIVSIVGFVWFYKNFHQPLIRKIIWIWLFVSIIMYTYTTVIPKIDHMFNILMPDTVPSFHYFFYLKALQSVFFGFGFVSLIKPFIYWLYNLVNGRIPIKNIEVYTNCVFITAILLCVLISFPSYKNRWDFVQLRKNALIKQNDKDKIEIYHYIVQNIAADKVILCDKDPSIFPVMATARKMVSIAYTFSNPYLNFDKRESDRNNMLSFLKTGQPLFAKKLFDDYRVSFVLLTNEELENFKNISPLFNEVIYRNNTYSIVTLKSFSVSSF